MPDSKGEPEITAKYLSANVYHAKVGADLICLFLMEIEVSLTEEVDGDGINRP